MPTLLIAGCGYVGCALGSAAPQLLGADWQVFGLRRSARALPEPIIPLVADLGDPALEARLPRGPIDAVVVAVAAKDGQDEAYARTYVGGAASLVRALQGHGTPRVIFVSSTSVYGVDDGRWVDETTAAEPRDFRGRRMLEAEAALQAGRFAACAMRCGGIYGPGRTRLIDSVRRGSATWTAGAQYTNRIHRDDCARALAHLILRPELPRVVLGVDDEPADKRQVLAHLARQLGVSAPVEARPASAGPEAPATGKRCRNAALRRAGYAFLYPTYREGYASLLAAEAAARVAT